MRVVVYRPGGKMKGCGLLAEWQDGLWSTDRVAEKWVVGCGPPAGWQGDGLWSTGRVAR